MSPSDNRTRYLYKATNQINNKLYIGQSLDPKYRWNQHLKNSYDPEYPFQFAIRKYGFHNFIFEVIATCKSLNDANELEILLIDQYDSYVSNGKGYNATRGGFNWCAPLPPEEKAARSEMLRKAMFRQIEEQGHPSFGKKRTVEQCANMSYVQQNKRNNNYTPEMRQMFSIVHSGRKQSENAVKNRVESMARSTKLRHEKEIAEGKWKCNAPACDIIGPPEPGKDKYGLYNSKRYCLVHLGRLKYHGTTDKLPPKGPVGQEPANKVKFTKEQIENIMTDPRSAAKVGKDFGVGERVIWRVRRENK